MAHYSAAGNKLSRKEIMQVIIQVNKLNNMRNVYYERFGKKQAEVAMCVVTQRLEIYLIFLVCA